MGKEERKPAPERRKKALAAYRRRWESTNDVLYRMVRQWPDHSQVDQVTAKVHIIGRTYASGIERHASNGIQGIVETLLQCRKWLDPAVRDLRKLRPMPTSQALERIGEVHGRLLDALSGQSTRNGNKPRSFVSKYLHFHAPCFPIYDSIASRTISSPRFYPWEHAWELEYPLPEEADRTYWRYCVRILRMADDWRRAGVPTTSRDLDTYLLAERPG